MPWMLSVSGYRYLYPEMQHQPAGLAASAQKAIFIQLLIIQIATTACLLKIARCS